MTFLMTAAIAGVAGTALTAVGMIQQGKAAKSAAKFKAKEILNQQMNDELETREEIRRQRIRNRKDLATQKLAQVKEGFATDAGSPLELRAESAANMELQLQDQLRAQKVRARKSTGEATLSIFEGQTASTASKIGAGAALLQGASNTYSIFKSEK